MPFVRISLPEQFNSETREKISKAVHESLMEAFNVPRDNYFQVIEALQPHQMKYPETYLDVSHTQDIVFIQITAAQGRTPEQKAKLYKEIAGRIESATPVTRNNIIIVLMENDGWNNWSFGNGGIQEPKHLKK